MKHWITWGLFLCFFAIGVMFDTPLLRVVGGTGFTIILYFISGKQERDERRKC